MYRVYVKDLNEDVVKTISSSIELFAGVGVNYTIRKITSVSNNEQKTIGGLCGDIYPAVFSVECGFVNFIGGIDSIK